MDNLGNIWYRNAGRERYHIASPEWVKSGLGACGAKIPRPRFTLQLDAFYKHDMSLIGRDWRAELCKHCLKLSGERDRA